MRDKLFAGNDNDLVVSALKDDSTGQYINDAVIVCNIHTGSETGDIISGGTDVSVPFVSMSNGDYLGVLPASAGVTAGVTHFLVFTASNYGLRIVKVIQAETRRD